MKKTNKIVAMLLAAVSILSLSAMAFFSPEEAVVDRALEEVTGLYTNVIRLSPAPAKTRHPVRFCNRARVPC